jgi:hypothetical protein
MDDDGSKISVCRENWDILIVKFIFCKFEFVEKQVELKTEDTVIK